MRRTRNPIALVAATVLAGCGGGETETVTVVRTVTVPAPSTTTPQTGGTTVPSTADDPAAKRRRSYCDSPTGDAVQQAGAEATKAFNERDVDAMLEAQKKVFAAAEKAPEGASCAVVALNTLRFHWNSGAQAFKGHDYRAEAEQVRRFQAEHKLVGPLPG